LLRCVKRNLKQGHEAEVVYDTNVIVSAALKPKSIPALLVSLALKHQVRLFLSREVFEEYETVLKRPELNLRPHRLGVFLHDIQKTAALVRPTKRLAVASDESDNRFLECAERARADYLVTGNTKHFPASFKGTEIVSPREFADLLVKE
jgi:putative PIN family toxin of toxin-antitoxin system